jgi:hypothetical protein
MNEFYSSEVSASQFSIPETPVPDGGTALQLSLSHWLGGNLDVDLDVSYDGGATWMYGGGGKGAISAEAGIEFNFTYQIPPTHVRGSFTSDQLVNSTVRLSVGK